jgi:RNA polymerase sigma-70 factor (ECF subfamily)
MDTTSASLLERLRRPGERQAWDRFVELYTPFLFYWARRVGLQGEEADDLVQDVFTTLLGKLPEFVYDPSRSFRAWLRTVALNTWRERCRRQAAEPRANGDIDWATLSASEAESLWDAEQSQRLIRRALELMQSDFQPATWKACWETVAVGRPIAEVAAELDMSVGAVYAARFRVLARLREELAGLID